MSRRVSYLICFRDPATGEPARYQHAGHYLGDTEKGREAERLQEHRDGQGAVLTAAARAAGLDFVITRTWPGGASKARQLKTQSGARYCPACTDHPLEGNARPGRWPHRTRRQREAAARAREAAEAASARQPERTPLWQLERTAVDVEPHECGPECGCGQIEAAVSQFLASIGAEPREENEMTDHAESADFARERADAWRRGGYDEEARYWQEVAENHERQAGELRQAREQAGDPVQLQQAVRDWMADLPQDGRAYLQQALADAIEGARADGYCGECEAAAAVGPCPDHQEEAERRASYAARLTQLEAEDAAGYQPEPLPRQLGPAEAADALAPLAAELPDGTLHADPFLAGRGWQAQGGIYQRVPQPQAEAG